MAAELTPEQTGQAALAILRALIREQQLLEAVAPLDELLDGHPLEAIGHDLGLDLARVQHDLQALGASFTPAVADAAAGAPPPDTES